MDLLFYLLWCYDVARKIGVCQGCSISPRRGLERACAHFHHYRCAGNIALDMQLHTFHFYPLLVIYQAVHMTQRGRESVGVLLMFKEQEVFRDSANTLPPRTKQVYVQLVTNTLFTLEIQYLDYVQNYLQMTHKQAYTHGCVIGLSQQASVLISGRFCDPRLA